jgi:hypothetical protein
MNNSSFIAVTLIRCSLWHFTLRMSVAHVELFMGGNVCYSPLSRPFDLKIKIKAVAKNCVFTALRNRLEQGFGSLTTGVVVGGCRT